MSSFVEKLGHLFQLEVDGRNFATAVKHFGRLNTRFVLTSSQVQDLSSADLTALADFVDNKLQWHALVGELDSTKNDPHMPNVRDPEDWTGRLRVYCACVGLANVLANHNENESALNYWARRVCEAVGAEPPETIPSLGGSFGDGQSNSIKWVNGFFSQLATGNPRAEEAWDLTLVLLGSDPREAVRCVNMRVLSVDLTGQRHGFAATLRLELVESACGRERMIRHPGSYLTPWDDAFKTAFGTALEIAKEGFEWGNESEATTLKEGFTIRWHYDCPGQGNEFVPLCGSSIGGAVSAGAILLTAGEESDPTIAVSCVVKKLPGGGAATDGVGNRTLDDKIKAAEKADCFLLILSDDQAKSWKVASNGSFPVMGAKTPLEIAKIICNEGGPFKALRESVYASNLVHVDLLNGQRKRVDEIYISSPLLKEVRREELADDRAKKQETSGKDGATAPTGPPPDTYFEASSDRRFLSVFERNQPIEKVFAQASPAPTTSGSGELSVGSAPRVILLLLGEPGSGKSTQAQYLAAAFSREHNPLLSPQGAKLLPALVRLRNWKKGQRLADYLAGEVFANSDKTKIESYLTKIESYLDQGRVLLMFDGLDETNRDGNDILDVLKTYDRCSAVVTCRTVSRTKLDQLKDVGGVLGVFKPSPLTREQQLEFLAKWYQASQSGTSPKEATKWANSLVEEAEAIPSTSHMLSNPMLLSVIAFVKERARGGTIPTTRAALYEKAVGHLLDDATTKMRGEEPLWAFLSPYEHTFAKNLGKIALYMMHETKGVGTDDSGSISSNKVIAHLAGTFANPDEFLGAGGKKPTNDDDEKAGQFVKAISAYSRLLDAADDSDGQLVWLHRTFMEYLTAFELKSWLKGFETWDEESWKDVFAKKIDPKNNSSTGGQATAIRLTGAEAAVEFLDRNSWLAEFREVFLFLAGCLDLEGKIAYLRFLYDEFVPRDDVNRSRRNLAALCLPEL